MNLFQKIIEIFRQDSFANTPRDLFEKKPSQNSYRNPLQDSLGNLYPDSLRSFFHDPFRNVSQIFLRIFHRFLLEILFWYLQRIFFSFPENFPLQYFFENQDPFGNPVRIFFWNPILRIHRGTSSEIISSIPLEIFFRVPSEFFSYRFYHDILGIHRGTSSAIIFSIPSGFFPDSIRITSGICFRKSFLG